MKMLKKPGKIKFLIGVFLQISALCLFVPAVYMHVKFFYDPQPVGLGGFSILVTIPMTFLFFSLFFIGRALSRTLKVEFPDQKEIRDD